MKICKQDKSAKVVFQVSDHYNFLANIGSGSIQELWIGGMAGGECTGRKCEASDKELWGQILKKG